MELKVVANHYSTRLYDISADHGKTWTEQWLYDYEANQMAKDYVVKDHYRDYVISK